MVSSREPMRKKILIMMMAGNAEDGKDEEYMWIITV